MICKVLEKQNFDLIWKRVFSVFSIPEHTDITKITLDFKTNAFIFSGIDVLWTLVFLKKKFNVESWMFWYLLKNKRKTKKLLACDKNAPTYRGCLCHLDGLWHLLQCPKIPHHRLRQSVAGQRFILTVVRAIVRRWLNFFFSTLFLSPPPTQSSKMS